MIRNNNRFKDKKG